MQAVILCGGRGTRMLPLTRDVPKCMLPVGGVPFIDHVILALKECGFDEMLLLVSHLGEQVVKWCKAGSRYGVRTTYSWDSGVSMQDALDTSATLLAPEFLLTYGDTWLAADYSEPMTLLYTEGYSRVVTVWPNDGLSNLKSNMVVEGRMCRHARSGETARFVEAGMTAYRRYPRDNDVYAYRLDGLERPYEIGSPEGYALMCKRLAGNPTLVYQAGGER